MPEAVTMSLGSTIGALQIGSLFSVFLFGIESLQTHMYFQTVKDDKWQFKTLVTVLWGVELGHTYCVAAEVYRVTVTYYGRPDKILPFVQLAALTTLGGLITLMAQSFFALRCYKVLPKYWNLVGVLCFVVALVRFVGSIVLGVNASQQANLAEGRAKWAWLSTSLLIVGACVDILIAVSMMYWLIQQRKRVFARTGRLLDRLVQFTVCTGLLTSVGAVIMVIVYYVLPNGLEWLALYTCLAKLYSNSILAALNNRNTLRMGLSDGTSSADPASRSHGGLRRTQDPTSMVIAVEMKSTVHTAQDEPSYMAKPFSFEGDQEHTFSHDQKAA